MEQEIFGDFKSLIIFAIIISITIGVSWLFNFMFNRYIKGLIKRIHADPTNYQFIRHFLTGIIYMIGVGLALLTLPNMQSVAHTLLAGAGMLTLVAGLASEQALSNIFNELFLVIFKSFRVNDRMLIKDTYIGYVEDILCSYLSHSVVARIFRIYYTQLL